MKSITPNIFVSDMNKTIAFYESLGFEIKMRMPETGNPDWVAMTCGKVEMMFQSYSSLAAALPEIHRQDGGSLLLYIHIDKINEFFEKVKGKGKILAGLEKTFYGATEFSILDNNGYVLTFAEHENQ